VKELLVEITELGVDGSKCSDGVSLTECEDVLASTGGVGDVEPYETAIEERDERENSGESATRVQTLVDSVAALREGQDPNIRVFDGEQLQDAFTEDCIPVQVKLAV